MASYKQYRAPAENNAALVDPPWPELRARLAEPSAPADLTLGGAPLSSLATAARRGLLDAARRYTGRYADVATGEHGPVVVSGHQPELFHPGVWFKNFALDSLAKSSAGVGVHLLIDSDLCRTTAVRTPTGTVASPRYESVPYDQAAGATPYEERRVLDRATFDSFAGRVRDAIAPLAPEPLVGGLWPQAIESLDRTGSLASALSEGRHRLERHWGSTTLELPFSAVGDSEGFRRLAAELLLRADETLEAYNGALAEYRDAHHLKNAAQPLPDLHGPDRHGPDRRNDDGWFETPLWVWSEAQPTRRALYARRDDPGVTLTDRSGWTAHGPADADGVVAWLAELRAQGVKVRSRALVTTLYCRLVLADLFLHGIGGAKYDQVTDRFAERLLGVAPPPHATLTATLRLPIDHDAPTQQDRRQVLRRLRDLRYHPERFVNGSEAAAEKRRWIATPKTPANAAERHEAITAANRSMAESLLAERLAAEERLTTLQHGLRAAKLLDSREHSFCLFPADDVRDRLQRLITD